MSKDITFCANMCSYKKCPRNLSHLSEADGKNVSYAMLKGTKDCPRENKKDD